MFRFSSRPALAAGRRLLWFCGRRGKFRSEGRSRARSGWPEALFWITRIESLNGLMWWVSAVGGGCRLKQARAVRGPRLPGLPGARSFLQEFGADLGGRAIGEAAVGTDVVVSCYIQRSSVPSPIFTFRQMTSAASPFSIWCTIATIHSGVGFLPGYFWVSFFFPRFSFAAALFSCFRSDRLPGERSNREIRNEGFDAPSTRRNHVIGDAVPEDKTQRRRMVDRRLGPSRFLRSHGGHSSVG